MPRIYIMNGPDKGRSFEVDEEAIFIGRAPDNEIPVKDKSVSRKHLKIVKRGEKYYVTDLGSKNGTFLDGMRIAGGKEYEVREGMPIAAGKTFLSLGKAYPEDVLAVLDSIDLFKELDEEGKSEGKDRPMTAKHNMGSDLQGLQCAHAVAQHEGSHGKDPSLHPRASQTN